MSNFSSSYEFSCFESVSRNSVHELAWSVARPGIDFDTVSNGYGIAAVIILFFLVGLPWNAVVIGIIIKKRLFTDPPMLLLLNLAFANFLACIIIMPFNIISGIAGEYIFGGSDQTRCRVCQTGIALLLLPIVSTHTLALMAVDRFIYLKKPLTYHLIVTPWRMLMAIASVWLICILLALPPLFGLGEIQFSYTLATCTVLISRETRIAPNYIYSLVLIGEGAVPFLTLCVMYVWILYITRVFLSKSLRRTLAASDGQRESRQNVMKEYSKNQLLLVRVFGIIFTSNIVTWLPLVPLAISVAVLDAGQVPTVVYTIAYVSYISSTVIHPILQACLTQGIRTTIKDWFSSLCKRTRYPAFTQSSRPV